MGGECTTIRVPVATEGERKGCGATGRGRSAPQPVLGSAVICFPYQLPCTATGVGGSETPYFSR